MNPEDAITTDPQPASPEEGAAVEPETGDAASSAPKAEPICPSCGEAAARRSGKCTACGERIEPEPAPSLDTCPVCGMDTPVREDARCGACLERFDREDEPQDLRARVRAVLLTPEEAFSYHRASWGWAKPWLLVTALGLLFGVVTLARVDVSAVAKSMQERQLDRMSPAMKKAMEANADAAEMQGRLQGFIVKGQLFVGPPLGGLLQLLVFGGALFVAGRFLGGPETPRDLMRSLSLVAYVGLADGVGYAARTVGVVLGTAMPVTSLAGLVDPVGHPVLHTGLARLDPVLFLYYGLLAVGLLASLRFPRKRAIGVAVGMWGGFSVLQVGLAGLGALAQGMAGGS